MRNLIIIALLFIFLPSLAQHNIHREKARKTITYELVRGEAINNMLIRLNVYRENPAKAGRVIKVNLREFKKMGKLEPDSALTAVAEEKAMYLSKIRTLTHKNADGSYSDYEECITTGDIVEFIIDDGVPDLGHRKACLSSTFTKVGIGYAKNSLGERYCVLEFR